MKRRPLAHDLCETGAVTVNDRSAKPGRRVKVRDRIGIRYPNRYLEVEVLEVREGSISRQDAAGMVLVLRDERRLEEDLLEVRRSRGGHERG